MEMFQNALSEPRRSAMLLYCQYKTLSGYFSSMNLNRMTAFRVVKNGVSAHFMSLKRLFNQHRSGTTQISFDGSSVARRHDLTLFTVSTAKAGKPEECYMPTLALPQVQITRR